MQGLYSRRRIRVLSALTAMILLAACDDANTNFLVNEADLLTAIAKLRSAIGGHALDFSAP